jgi:hypothetical protein
MKEQTVDEVLLTPSHPQVGRKRNTLDSSLFNQ